MRGVSLPPQPPAEKQGNVPGGLRPPALNGNEPAVWAVINANPGLVPHTLSLLIETATGIRLNGAQVKALIANGPPAASDALDNLPF